VCLFGEHSDWAGGLRSPAHPHIAPGATLVVGLSKEGLHARARRRRGTLMLRSVLDHGEVLGPVEFPMDVGTLLTRAAEGGFWSYACGVAAKLMSMFEVGGLEIDNYCTTLPVRKGLSSSAAMCVLVARAFNRAYGLGLSVRGEMELAYQGEICTPSACGRMDQACAYGPRPVLMRYDGDSLEVDELAVGAPLHYVVADLNAAKSTVAIIEALRASFPLPQSAAHEGVQQLLGPLNLDITARAVAAVAAGDAPALGALMTEAQALFDRYGGAVCPEELTAPVLHRVLADERLRPHVYGGKGVGSQGDGCVQFLCKSLAAQAEAAAILRNQLGLTTLELTIEPTSGDAGDSDNARRRWLNKTRERIEMMRIASSERLQALRATSGDAWARATQQGGLEPPL
jgi:mevalonate kinase